MSETIHITPLNLLVHTTTNIVKYCFLLPPQKLAEDNVTLLKYYTHLHMIVSVQLRFKNSVFMETIFSYSNLLYNISDTESDCCLTKHRKLWISDFLLLVTFYRAMH